MIELYDWQREAVKELRANMAAKVMNQVLAAPTGCHAPGTMVLRADGTAVAVEDVEIGDRLLGPDGTARNVLSLFHGDDMMYRVTPVKGDPYECNEDHILSLRRTGNQPFNLADGRRIEPTDDIVDVGLWTLLDSTKWARHCLKGWRAGPIEFPDAPDAHRPMPPYLLGAWLGNGTARLPAISKPPCRMVDEWEEWALSLGAYIRTDDSGGTRCPTHSITTGRDGPRGNPALDILRDLQVLENRHVPDAYRYAPLDERLELLAGLLDSDGHFDSTFDWITKDWRLAEDFAFVARSCGFACYLTECEKGIAATGFNGTYWRASLSGDLARIPTRDKRATKRQQIKRHLVHGIKVERIGLGEYFGFALDGDHRYLLADFTVTHNSGKTVMAAYIMQAAADRKTRCVFVADRIALIDQTSMLFDHYGIDHGVIQAQHWRWRPWKPIQIASAQTLARRDWPEDIGLIVVDECFPAGTMIATPDGPVDIAYLRGGMEVHNALGTGTVRSTFCKLASELLEVRLTDGSRIRCTPDHPFFTTEGWQEARALGLGAILVRREGVRALREGVPATSGAQYRGREGFQLSAELFNRMWEQLAVEAESLEPVVDEEQPDAQPEIAAQDVAYAPGDGARAEAEGWQRSSYPGAAAGASGRARAGLGSGARGENAREAARLSIPLQDRPGAPGQDDRDRGGRREPRGPRPAGTGREEGRAAQIARVAGVSRVELESPVPVYNLHVSGHPSYYAGGVLVHNCHTVYKSTVKRIQERDCFTIGLSATPLTRGLGKIFDEVVTVRTHNQLQEDGYLCPWIAFSTGEPDMTGAKVTAGEWTDAAAEERTLPIVGNAVAEYMRHADGQKFIAFGVTVKHCEALARGFAEAGIQVGLYTYRTPDVERTDLIAEFQKPDSRLKGLVSVAALSKGFDAPNVSCIIMCRPLKSSLIEHIQVLGRGLRRDPDNPDKVCTVLDHAGNMVRHWSAMQDFFEHGIQQLDDGKLKKRGDNEKKEPKAVRCPTCAHIHPKRPNCPKCGHEYPKPKAPDHAAGELSKLTGKTIAQIRQDPSVLGLGNDHETRQAIYSQLLFIADEREYKEGWAAYQFKNLFGEWPGYSLGKHRARPSPWLRNWIRSNLRRYAIEQARKDES